MRAKRHEGISLLSDTLLICKFKATVVFGFVTPETVQYNAAINYVIFSLWLYQASFSSPRECLMVEDIQNDLKWLLWDYPAVFPVTWKHPNSYLQNEDRYPNQREK